MGKICAQFHKGRKFFSSVIQGLKEKKQAVKLVKFNVFFKKQAQNNQLKLQTNLSQKHNLSNTESPCLSLNEKN